MPFSPIVCGKSNGSSTPTNFSRRADIKSLPLPPQRYSPIILSTPTAAMPSTTPLLAFLQRLQYAALLTFGPGSFDPKLYVDLPLLHDLPAVVSAFDGLPRTGPGGSVPRGALEGFLQANLGPAGDDLVPAEPADFAGEPEGFLPGVESGEVRAWALEVHALWRSLSRRVSDEVRERPDRHTLLPLPDLAVVPGSRFREVYYWDSYWSIRGLLASKMFNSAKAIVNNLLSLLDTYGFVLNGARAYYTNRSQPPLLSSMVLDIYDKTGDFNLVERSLPALLKEHNFWNTGIHQVIVKDSQGRSHCLSRYYAMWNKPRPESATIDKESASKLHNDAEREMFYRDVASTAESGWDFSSRWMSDPSGKKLTTLSTTSILPVDLNTYILKMELDISFFASLVGDTFTSTKFKETSELRRIAMDSIFWNADLGQWLDYWIHDGPKDNGIHVFDSANQNKHIFASNFVPLWVKAFHSDALRVQEVITSFKSSGLLRSGGIATSLTNTGQQWDFPNGWAPLQQMIVEGMAKSTVKQARSLAEDIAIQWIRTNYASYRKTGAMHEKYNVEVSGEAGGGGEYEPQTGFGWSNGVVLSFLEEFGWPKDRKLDCHA